MSTGYYAGLSLNDNGVTFDKGTQTKIVTTIKNGFLFIFVKNTNSLRPLNPIGTPFLELSEVDSTNNYAMRQVQAHLADHGATWFAHTQNAGKGQRGKPWDAEPGQNILMSSVFKPSSLTIDNQFILNIAFTLACYDFFNSYVIDKVSIKWPNDIYWRDRKAGGILIENVIKGSKWRFAIAGIGININQTFFPEHLRNPVSLKQITGKSYEVVQLAKELCGFIEKRWQQCLLGSSEELVKEYSSHLYKLEEKVTFRMQTAEFIAAVKGVNTQGELLVDTGKENIVLPGGVQWIIN